MNTYKEFKQAYKKYFLESQDFPAAELVSDTDDIPTEDEYYKNAVIRGYVLLSNCKSRDIGHLKILTNYEKLMKRNREAGMNTNPVVFATMLYIFHQYCIRILRSPWRTDFFTIKAYNGFYQYTLRKALAPSVIEDLMSYIGFKFHALENVYIFQLQSLDHACVRTITDAGIGFFLSYTHCMAKNDVQFKRTVPGLIHLLQDTAQVEPPASLPAAIQSNRSPDRPSTSRLADQEHRSQTENYSLSDPRERRREKRNLYGSEHAPASTSLMPRTNNADIYGAQEGPVDLSMRNGTPYGHRVKKISDDRQSNSSSHGSPGSSYTDLYGGSEPKSTNADYFTVHDREDPMPEPAPVSRGYSTLNAEMERFRVKDTSPSHNSMTPLLYGKPLLDRTKRHPASYNNRDINYVKLFPTASTAATQRGSPDGEIASEPTFDYPPSTQHTRSSTHRDPKRSSRSNTHIYHEIN